MNKRRALPLAAALLATTSLALAGCGMLDDATDEGSDRHTKEHQVDTGAQGKEDELLAEWVPDEAQDVQVMQRTTGSERLLTFDYAGEVPESCLAIETTGDPSEEELETAYATDLRTQDSEVREWTTTPTLEAEWWAAGTESSTTHLCGRWWVSADNGTFYGFAAEFEGWA